MTSSQSVSSSGEVGGREKKEDRRRVRVIIYNRVVEPQQHTSESFLAIIFHFFFLFVRIDEQQHNREAIQFALEYCGLPKRSKWDSHSIGCIRFGSHGFAYVKVASHV